MYEIQAQNFSELYLLYQNKDIAVLKQKLESVTGQYPDNKEIIFFNALFLENGEEAFKIYEHLYPEVSGNLKRVVGEKLAQYYYARGFYVRAAEYENDQITIESSSPAAVHSASPQVKSDRTGDKKANFVIQLGAFGQEDNARQLQKTLQAQNITSRLVTRMVNGRNLFCIWIEGTNSLEETLQIAENLKNRFKLNYRILEN